jgi:hypothetical protein
MLVRVELSGLLAQADALHANRPFSSTSSTIADFWIAVKHSGRRGSQVIKGRLTCNRTVPCQASNCEHNRGSDLT